jgi:DNA-binding PadR family transcriptional regulator
MNHNKGHKMRCINDNNTTSRGGRGRHRSHKMRDGFRGGMHRGRGLSEGGGSREGGRRRRQFDGEELRTLILGLIAERARHGYDLIRALSERSGGAYAPSPGMVYPLLQMLADQGLVEDSSEGQARKSFALTDAGMAEWQARTAEAEALFARLDAMASQAERTDAEPVRRAMHNLRSVVIARLGRDDADKETLFAAVALIDGAAQAIERL